MTRAAMIDAMMRWVLIRSSRRWPIIHREVPKPRSGIWEATSMVAAPRMTETITPIKTMVTGSMMPRRWERV